MTNSIQDQQKEAVCAALLDESATYEVLREAVSKETQGAINLCVERQGSVAAEYLLKREGVLKGSIRSRIDGMDTDVDRSREEQEALEYAQRLTESHLGFKMSFRNGEGGKLVDVAFTHIDPKDPEQCFSALLRVDGGFESALLG